MLDFADEIDPGRMFQNLSVPSRACDLLYI